MNLNVPTSSASLLLLFFFINIECFYIHEEVQELEEKADISEIKILYNDTITPTHIFPDAFWIEITSTKTGDKYKFEFDIIDDPALNTPINLWKSDLQGDNYELHKNTESESWAKYQLMNNDEAFGVGTLIRNDKGSSSTTKTSSSFSNKDKHLFRMIGSITFGNNFVEIVPYITKEQQARKKRSVEDDEQPAVYEGEYDNRENTHMIKVDAVPVFEHSEPIVPSFSLEKLLPLKTSISKRNTDRVQYHVELLAVFDESAFALHQRFYKINDSDKIHDYMRIYYSHVFNNVNYMYRNSFANDTEATFNIILTNMLFIENSTETVWLNSSFVGNGSEFNGRELLHKESCLENFAKTMMTLSQDLPITYDMAVSIFNKDLYDNFGNNVAGLAYLDSVCEAKYKYVLAEDWGSSNTAFLLAHEIGHNSLNLSLGADHDGFGRSSDCSSSDNFIMSNVELATYAKNSYLFSNCSREAFKKTARLTTCLTNFPTATTHNLTLVSRMVQGQVFDANAQCRMRFGPDAIFDQSSTLMCSNLFCYPNMNSTVSQSAGPAFEGTSCGSGMWCSYGSCVANRSAPRGTCLHGDMFLMNNDNSYGMGCDEGLQHYSEGNTISFKSLCMENYYYEACCSTCKKYLKMPDCEDKFTNCPATLKQYCGNPKVTVAGNLTDYSCPLSCGLCTINATCDMYGSICQNGAICVDNPTGQNGFKCECPTGYHGGVCEYKNVNMSAIPEPDFSPETANETLAEPVTSTTVSPATTPISGRRIFSTFTSTYSSESCSCTCSCVNPKCD